MSLNFILNYSLPQSLLETTVSDTKSLSLCNLLLVIKDHSNYAAILPDIHTLTEVMLDQWLSHTDKPLVNLSDNSSRITHTLHTHACGVGVWIAGSNWLIWYKPAAISHIKKMASKAIRQHANEASLSEISVQPLIISLTDTTDSPQRTMMWMQTARGLLTLDSVFKKHCNSGNILISLIFTEEEGMLA